jgi:Periplasmic copper-binding protein (NosD)
MYLPCMKVILRAGMIVGSCALFVIALPFPSSAKTLCVNRKGSRGCYSTIQEAVNNASPYDVIEVGPGKYAEQVTIGISLSVIGANASSTVIDAAGLAHGIFVDGFDNPGLHDVTVAGFTIENALYEGVLAVSAADVVLRDNKMLNNDQVPNVVFTGDLTGCPNQPGSGSYEMDETGDCGGAIHLIGVASALVSGNFVSGNADGILISDETAESHDNAVVNNIFKDNPLECGIVLASHPNAGNSTAPFAEHFGVNNNTVAENISVRNGVKIGGAGVGMFSDGSGQGHVHGNVIIGNTLVGNGLGGVDIHTHVGPAFGLPADDMNNNQIIGNVIAKNLADTADTATPGPVGININSGDGGSPILGTVISQNIIRDEAVDVAINTPAVVNVHLNDLEGKKLGIADVCALDGASICTGKIDATENYWGCPSGPGDSGCSSTSGSDINFTPWLKQPVGGNGNH